MIDHQINSLRVAVIDDKETASSGLCRQLESLGHKPVLFESAEDFLALAKPEAFDCILLDLWFNGKMNGLEFLRHFPQPGIGTPVVMISDAGDIDTALEAGARGVVAFLSKPIRMRQLEEALGKAWEREIAVQTGFDFSHGDFACLYRMTFDEWKALLGKAATKLAPQHHQPFSELTPAEVRVFILLACENPSNQEIANRLNVSVRTVESHRANVADKLNTRNPLDMRDHLTGLLRAANGLRR
ncbi:MAG: response regulator [Methylococcaceae bacterium]|nr:response regulator [Methylococcaceae bacterium]